MAYTYAELPDTVISKEFLPMCNATWKLYQELGWERLEPFLDGLFEVIGFDMWKSRLDDAVVTAQKTISGEIKQPSKVMSYMTFPPVTTIRADIQEGTNKLLYGSSVDCTFVAVRDYDAETLSALNVHLEDGVPVDWWLVMPGDELLERRHLKLGTKFKDIHKRTKNITKTGERFIEILKDIRNERTPQWASSSYFCFPTLAYPGIDKIFEVSNYEMWASSYLSFAAKQAYGLKDSPFRYVPWPPLIPVFIALGKRDFTLRFTGLTSGHNLYLSGFSDTEQRLMTDNFPEEWNTLFVKKLEKEGVPVPYQTINCQVPDFKKKSTYTNEDFERKYPKGDLLTSEDLGMDTTEVLKGVYLDINHEAYPDNMNLQDKIISVGIGKNTEIK